MEFSFTPEKNSKALESFGRNLTNEAINNKLEPTIGRDDEIRRLIRILSRKTKNNPILVGEPGVGKTAIVEGLAQRIVLGDVPENLKSKEIYEIDLPAMIAGASFQGQFEKRLKNLMNEIKESNGEIIVFIDEVHMLMGAGKNGTGGMDASQILKPMLARGEMRLIGATTIDEYVEYIEKDSAFERRMQKIVVNEPSEEEAVTILRGIKDRLEAYHGVKIHDEALVSAINLSKRYITNRFLPDKAIDLVDEAAAAIQAEVNSKPEVLEKTEKKLAILKMEQVALSKEKDIKSKNRLIELDAKIKKVDNEQKKLYDEWVKEKQSIENISKYKNKLEELKVKQSKYQSSGDYEKASEILYIDIPNMEKKIDLLEKDIKSKEKPLLREDVKSVEIADIVARWTGIPVNKLLKDDRKQILDLENNLLYKIRGQDEAVKLISNTILTSKADIHDPKKPIGSFIFMGPTGTGKTELAKKIAFELFNSEDNLVRLDMSEYMEKHSVAKLIGSPPGYVGFSQDGHLLKAIKNKPYSLILLDEIEKAHPDVLNVLLQILDYGSLTNSKGKTIDFKNTIIIMTSNIGATQVLDNKVNEAKNELKKFFKSEFINRIDEIVVFNALNKKTIEEIAKIELKKLNERLDEKNIHIEFDNSIVTNVATNGYDPVYGARPIKRYLKRFIEIELAKKIINNDIKEGNFYTVSTINNVLIFKEKKMN